MFDFDILVDEMPLGAVLRLINDGRDYDIRKTKEGFSVEREEEKAARILHSIFGGPRTKLPSVNREDLQLLKSNTLFEYQENREFQSLPPYDEEENLELFVLKVGNKHFVCGYEGVFFEIEQVKIPEALKRLPVQKVLQPYHLNWGKLPSDIRTLILEN